MSYGFTTYVDESVVIPPTLEEMVNALTQGQKGAILNAFTDKLTEGQAKYVTGAPKPTISALYVVMRDTDATCRIYMRGEVIETPGDPPVYNTPPANITALKSVVSADILAKYPGVFTSNEIGAIINKIILVSKKDSNGVYVGVWSDYETGVQA